MFGRATIRLGIGPHSSIMNLLLFVINVNSVLTITVEDHGMS